MGNNDFFRYRRFVIDQRHAAMKVGTDCDLLGTLSATGNWILDIGTGTGIIALMHAQRSPEATIKAIEIDDGAAKDAAANFSASPFSDRISLVHSSFQDYLADQMSRGEEGDRFDTVVCNPPYFDRSLECPDESRTRARHNSSLPFDVLAEGAYSLLGDEGFFSVCVPTEVVEDFSAECRHKGFWLQDAYRIKSLPGKEPVLNVLVFRKGRVTYYRESEFCMRNADYSRSQWYLELMKDFHAG